ncbi:MAG: ISAzo13 family transposase [Acidobacteria bacterium]|nr:MAG: ISAzo13 family transposase [Acidobacteriota bacterium]
MGSLTNGQRLTAEERRWVKLLSTLNEAQARWFVADKALDLGRGGVSHLSQVTGMSRMTITKAMKELRGRGALRPAAVGRIRRAGAGRKCIEESAPEVTTLIARIVEETTAGDPMSLLRWTSKSTRTIAEEVARRGHRIDASTVGRCLHDLGYSLQANVKTKEGPQSVSRDEQFRYINRLVKGYIKTEDPVISVDTKKKELVGEFRNPGQTWRPHGDPIEVHVHDFPHLGRGKAVPYGAYDIARNRAVVNVGISHDTAEFAVESVRRWWRLDGRRLYHDARRLLICADSGGSNGPKLRAWKLGLQTLADEIAMPITVCHYPPGTSKWNKIEHRLFSFISLNWRGRPLVNYETVVNLIGATKTRTGLRVKAVLDTGTYAKGLTVDDQALCDVQLRRHTFHPDWNYTIESLTS